VSHDDDDDVMMMIDDENCDGDHNEYSDGDDD